MPRRKSAKEIIRNKLSSSFGGSGSFDYEPPSARRTMLKNDDDPRENHDDIVESLLRELIFEIVRPCDDTKYCLYTKKKDPKTGKRRRLGTHSTKQAAYRQEYAIRKSKGK